MTTILKPFTAFSTILKPFSARATIFKALTALLALTAHKALAKTVAITALIKTRTVPAVEVEAKRGSLDRINLVER